MDNKIFFLMVLIGSIILFLGVVLSIILLLMEKKEDWSEYDSYILSILWSPSFCFNKEQNQSECFDRLDELDINNSFIIHGLWPAFDSSYCTSKCNNDTEVVVKFSEEKEKSLSKIWPGLWSSDQKMWNDEYNKHGYCYIKRLRKDVEKNYGIYFDQAIYLFGEFKSIIETSFKYTSQGLHKITKTKFKESIESSGVDIKPLTYTLHCEENKEKNNTMLNEIWFNYDFNFEPTTGIQISENCPDRFDVYFRADRKPLWEIYDFYLMTVLWPATLCREQGKECYNKIKKFKERDELNIFTIHGLWPSYHESQNLQWCNLDTNIEVKNFTKDMEEYWINIYKRDNKEFWEQEYNKHGFCYNQRLNLSTDDYLEYFNKTVEVYKNFSLMNLMRELYPGRFPGINRFNLVEMETKLGEKFGKGHTTITCRSINNVKYLYEIRLKLDLNFTNSSSGAKSSDCPPSFYAEILEVEGPQKETKDYYKEYDMYFFTILWLGTTCHQKGWQCYERIQNVPKNTFTIHGLWPNLRNGTIADFCHGVNDIEIEIKDTNLFNFMNKSWVSGYHTNEYFWGHEYNKHGYCYNQKKGYDVNDYEKYFQKSKEIFINNNFDNLFLDFFKKEQIEIKTGDIAINRNKFEKYFEERGFGKDYYLIVCTNITNNSTDVNPHISEIRIRYDLDFKLLKNETDKSEFDCPEIFYAQFL